MVGVSVPHGRLRQYFATPVVDFDVPQADRLNDELEAAILAKMASTKGIQVSNRGGWHSDRDFGDWSGKAGRQLLSYVLAVADQHTVGPKKGEAPEWQTDAWANVSQSGHFNMPHVHGATFWAAVYFVRTGEGSGGELVLHDPRMPGLQMHAPGVRFKGNGEEGEVAISPRPGLLVLFPGWLAHSVEPWHGTGNRISVAMNIRARMSS